MRSDSGAWLHAARRPLSHEVEGQPGYPAAHAREHHHHQREEVSGQPAHVGPAVPGPQQLLAHQALPEHQSLQHQQDQQLWQVQVEIRPAEHKAGGRDLAIADEDVDGYHGAAAADVDWEQEQGQEESPTHAHGEGTAAAPAHPPAAAEHGPSPAKKPRLWRPPPPASVAATAARQAQRQGGSSAAGLVIRGGEAGWAGASRALALGTAPRMPQSVGIGIPQVVPGVQAVRETRPQAQVQVQQHQQAQHRSFAQQQQQHQQHQRQQQQQRGGSAMLLAPAWLAALGPPPQESPRRKQGPGRPRKVNPPSELLQPLTQGTASGRAATGKTVTAAARKLRGALAAGDWPLEVLVVALQQAMLSCAAPHVSDAGAAASLLAGDDAAVEAGAVAGLLRAGTAAAAVSRGQGWMQWARASAQQRGTLQVLAACALQLDATAGAPDGGEGHDGAAVSEVQLAHGTGADAALARMQLTNATGTGAGQDGRASGGPQQDHGGAAGCWPGKVCRALLRRLHRCVCDPGTLSAPSAAAHGQQHGGPAGDLQQGWDGAGAYGLPLQQTERCALAAAHALLCREAGWLQVRCQRTRLVECCMHVTAVVPARWSLT